MIEKGVKEYFNLSKKNWDKRSIVVPFMETVEEDWVKKYFNFRKKDVVLDYACGIGRWTTIIHKKVTAVISIDIGSKLIKFLKSKKFKNVHPIVGSDDSLKKYPNHFDKIIFAQALEFYKNPGQLFKAFHKSLKRGGEFFLSSWTPTLLEVKREGNFVIAPRPSDKKIITIFFKTRTKSEIESLLKNSGFKNIKIETLKKRVGQLPLKIRTYSRHKNLNRLLDLLVVAKAIK